MKTQVQIDQNEILDFVEYVDSFYNPVTGVDPIAGATVEVITKAIKIYIAEVTRSDKEKEQVWWDKTWGGGDSVDRERVFEIILEKVGGR